MAAQGQQTMPWLFFSPSGRLPRLPYFLGWLFWVAVSGFVLTRMFANEGNDIALALWTLILVVSGLVSTASIVMLTIKRLHDIGYPGPLAICLFIPVLSPVVFITLCLWPGKPEANEYGP
ncbi:DUF805 domain-containing protein [Rhizobium giardinii]|jgi:uncharacterized membrane protein YhaH (DUF805 family)|uniref:Uncharacterized membrane protein YhaH (DUF805 family) n=1 Tax=Rhizobium giardinii TaxID=56731 RepID=A0A7W8X7P1_9HYPH|nr:DUF805 domain-containing protein [Rhizobium giardinii]MBB5533643.1 uncharacterized membrane protein YhaH (DUF805 family) [Rhizobium giardinii]